MENDGGTVVGGEAASIATALTNGHVNDTGSSSSSSDDTVIVKSVPKVTESSKSSEKIGENSSDVERFKSKLTESSDKVGDSVVDTKHYEENALKAMSERSDNAEMSSTTETRLGQVDKMETTASGVVKSLYKEDQEKKHETASKSQENAGNMSSMKEQSEKSHQRSSVTVDASSDGHHGVLVDLGNDTSSQSFEEIKGDGFRGTRKIESSTSERQMEYTSEGGPGGSGKPVDFAMQMDELFDPRGEYSKKDRDKRSVSFMEEFGELERGGGGAGPRGVMMDEMDGYASRRRGNYAAEVDHYSSESYASSASSRSRNSSRKENSLDEGGDWGLSTDRRTADDLIKRILAESRGKPLPPRSPVSRVQDEERPFSPSTRYSPSSPRYDPDDLPMRSGSRPVDNSSDPHTPTSPQKEVFKVDMGGGQSAVRRDPMAIDEEEEDIRSSTSSSSSHKRYESYNGEPMPHDGNMIVAMPKNKIRQPHQEMSLLDRRLASMGFDTKLGQEMYVDKEGGGNEGYVETTYISKTKPPGFIANEDEDDLDKEINAMRSSYRENIQRRNRYLEDDYDEEEPMQVGSRQAMESSYRSSRGRMVRQNYIEGGDAFSTYGAPPPPRRPEDEEDFIPDEEFVPQKRPETEEVVKEKTSNIRGMIEKQTSALEKLREASNSFDELNNEIRSMKQQFAENQLKRSYLMQEDFERPDDEGYPPTRGRGYEYGVGGGYASRVANYDRDMETEDHMGRSSYSSGVKLTDDYKPYIPRKERMAMQRSRSLYDDAPYMGGGRGGGEDDMMYDGGLPRQAPPQLSPGAGGAGPDGTGRYETMEDDEDDDALGYGGQPQRRPGPQSSAGGYNLDRDLYGAKPVARKGIYDFENDQEPPPRRNYDYDSHDQVSSSQRKSHDYESVGYSSTAAKYLSRPTFSRANTVSDFNFDRPSSPQFVRNDRYDRPSTFSSRFLDKVRDKKRLGPSSAPTGDTQSRDKPFQSRFLGSSRFTAGLSSSTSSSTSSYTSSKASSRVTSTGGASETSAISGGGASSSSDAPTQDKTETAASASESASAE